MVEAIRESILVVDDTPANRRLYTTILQDLDAEVLGAGSGAEALALAGSREFAMILLDVHLPDGSGFELAHRLRALPACASTPIVFVSAIYTRDEDSFRGYSQGAVDYLLAPVVPAILRAKAAVFIELLRSRREIEGYASRLLSANDALKSAYDELETFSYSVSHDLRNPLHGIIGLADLLQDYGDRLDAQGRTYVEHIAAGARQMNALIEDLLTLARITRADLQRDEVDLSALADDIRRGIESGAPQRRARWRIAPQLLAFGDAGLLRVLLANLLENAWKYSARRPQPDIEFNAERRDAQTVYFVRDNGAGFDPAKARDLLFKPFRRLHSEREFSGTGIGLATAQRVVARHGGRIWAEAQPDRGATFYFTLEP
jgi:signal transduction histidine kinase